MRNYYKKVVNSLILPNHLKVKVTNRISEDLYDNNSGNYYDLCRKFGKPKECAFVLSQSYFDDEKMKKYSFLQTLYSKRKIAVLLFFITSLLGIILFLIYPNNILRMRNSLFVFLNSSQLNSLYQYISSLRLNFLLLCSISLFLSIFSFIYYVSIRMFVYFFTHKL